MIQMSFYKWWIRTCRKGPWDLQWLSCRVAPNCSSTFRHPHCETKTYSSGGKSRPETNSLRNTHALPNRTHHELCRFETFSSAVSSAVSVKCQREWRQMRLHLPLICHRRKWGVTCAARKKRGYESGRYRGAQRAAGAANARVWHVLWDDTGQSHLPACFSWDC